MLEAALAIDASLVEVSEGLDQARPLAELFAKLDTIVEKQARLVDPVVLSEAQLSLSEAEAALAVNAQTSPVLKEKVEAVRSAVATASTATSGHHLRWSDGDNHQACCVWVPSC